MLKYISVVYFLCTGHALLSQNASTLIGARAQGIGYASACLSDEWSLFNNVAGVSAIDHLVAGFTYEAHPQFSSFNRTAFVFAMPMKTGVVTLGAFRFGDALYNEQLLCAGYANTFGLASLGIKVNYIQYHTESFGNKNLISISFGGIAKFSDHLSIGAHITNINQGKVSEVNNERLPTLLHAGLQFTPFSKVILTTEIQKDPDYPATWKNGIEYKPVKKFSFRTGFNLNPDAAFIGMGAALKHFTVNYAFQFFTAIGSNHQATIGYRFTNEKK